MTRNKTSLEANLEEIRANSRIDQIELDVLNVDRSYQRQPSQTMVDEIADDWDVIASELLLVSDRGPDWEGGQFWVVNGQHRSLAGRRIGVTHMDARIVNLSEFVDPGEVEAKFRLKTNVRLGDRPLERFKAQVRAGDQTSIAIVRLLAQFDTQINEIPNSEFGINAVSGVERLYEVDNGGLLRETLTVLREAFGQVQGKTATVALMNGTAWFILQHSNEADKNRFVERLKTIGTPALDRRARTIGSMMGGTAWMNYYRAMVDFYNERLHTRGRLDPKMRGAGNWRGAAAQRAGATARQ